MLKIISWNCGGKFREKYKIIEKLNADIYIIQECEDPLQTKSLDYQAFVTNHIWIGSNKNKGLGVFAKESVNIKQLDWPNYFLRYFLPVRINDKFDLLAVWASRPYIEEFFVYMSININNFNKGMVALGDFNSNRQWDKKHYDRTHTNVVDTLEECGLNSVYHAFYSEKQGEESKNTFYLYRNIEKGYHIDHCFANMDNVQNYEVIQDNEWLKHSDHMPIVLTYND